MAQTQKKELDAFSTAKLVNIKRCTGEQLGISAQPGSPTWPSRCGQHGSNWPIAQSPVLLPAPHQTAPRRVRESGQSAENEL